MITDLRQRGFKDGYEAAKKARQSGTSPKVITKTLFIDDRAFAKTLMEELKEFNVRWNKCFSLAIAYSFGYDTGVAHGAYETD